MATFEIFKNRAGEHCWRMKADNGEIVAQSDGYDSKAGARHGIEVIQQKAAGATVIDLTSSLLEALGSVPPPPPPRPGFPPPPRRPGK
jgi:uncharacterized protein YegP (UPF0339 family)